MVLSKEVFTIHNTGVWKLPRYCGECSGLVGARACSLVVSENWQDPKGEKLLGTSFKARWNGKCPGSLLSLSRSFWWVLLKARHFVLLAPLLIQIPEGMWINTRYVFWRVSYAALSSIPSRWEEMLAVLLCYSLAKWDTLTQWVFSMNGIVFFLDSFEGP